MDALDRFKILNNCLGYGNANAKIIHFSLFEEYGDWSIRSLAKMHKGYSLCSEEIENLCDDLTTTVEDKISSINSLLETNVLEILDKEAEKFNVLTNSIFECAASTLYRFSPTVNFQFKVSKFILENLSPEFKLNEIKYETFGTNYGNEICINLAPVGKNKSDKTYDEYKTFFGLDKGMSFPDHTFYEDRLKLIKKFLNNESIKKSEFYLIVYGNGPIRDIVEDIDFIEFEVEGSEESWFGADVNKHTWWLYHPTARGKEKPDSLNIPDIFSPLNSKRIKMRTNNKRHR